MTKTGIEKVKIMKIQINQKPVEMADGATVADAAAVVGLNGKGAAIAVNKKIVPKDSWAENTLHEGDDVIVIKAFCGG